MYTKSVLGQFAVALLSLTTVMGSTWARPSGKPLPAQNTGTEKTLTGMVTDSKCKGRIDRKGVTLSSCARLCTHSEGAAYVLLVGNTVYVLDGQMNELDKFAGGRATITGQVNGNRVSVESVTSAKKQG
jgi:hypothetical protein